MMEGRTLPLGLWVGLAVLVAQSSIAVVEAQASGATGDAELPNLLMWDCFNDTGLGSHVLEYEDVLTSAEMKTNHTLRQPDICMDSCEELGFEFSGIRNHTECWCSRSVDYRKHKAVKCVFCRGNHQYRCGGEGQTAVYFRPTAVPNITFVKCISFDADLDKVNLIYVQSEFSYVCYRNVAYRQATSCAQVCAKKGYKYAGITNQFWCHCGNQVGEERTTFCESCQGNRTQFCGQKSTLSIYEIEGVYPNATICGGSEQTIRSDSNAALLCRSLTGTEHLEFTWQRVDRFDRVLRFTPKMSVSQTGDTLLFHNIGIEETGRYRCLVEDLLIANRTVGISSAEVDLVVEKPPIVRLSQAKPAVNNQPVTLQCNVQAFTPKQPLSVQWFYGDTPLAPFSATLLSIHTGKRQPVVDVAEQPTALVPEFKDEPNAVTGALTTQRKVDLTTQRKVAVADKALVRPRFTLQELARNVHTSGTGNAFKLTINRVDHRYWGNYTCRIYNPLADTQEGKMVSATQRMWLNGETRKIDNGGSDASPTEASDAEDDDPCGIRRAKKNGNKLLAAALVFSFMITGLLTLSLYFLIRHVPAGSKYDVRDVIHRNNAFADGSAYDNNRKSTLPTPPAQNDNSWAMPTSPGAKKSSYRLDYTDPCQAIREEVDDIEEQLDTTFSYRC